MGEDMVENRTDNKKLLINTLKRLNINIDDLKKVDNTEYRIVVQKLIYFAKKIGLGFTYSYNIYLHGPYSTDLAKDYYSITNEDVNNCENILLDDAKIKKLEWLKDKPPIFLEIAATLDSIIEYNNGISYEDAINHVFSIKEEVLAQHNKDIEYIKNVLAEIRSNNLL
ncbi:MAG: hypothetical protein ACP5RS_07030 [Thermoplasmata archaeon]